METRQAITHIKDGIRWDVRNVSNRVCLSRSTIDNKRPGEWIPTQEAVVEPIEGRWLLTRWSIISDLPARNGYHSTIEEAMDEAKGHVDLRV